MYGTRKMKRATITWIALIIAVVYTFAMVGCILIVRNDRDVLSGGINSSVHSQSDTLNNSSDNTSSTVLDTSSDITSDTSSDISSTSSDVASSDNSSDISSNSSIDSSSENISSEETSSGSTSSGNTSSGSSSSGNTSSGGTVTPPKAQFTSAIWYAYYELDFKNDTEATFKQKINKMFDSAVDLGCDAVICQVRPFADALYYSEYFPMSVYMTGTQGKDPGYDALEYMVKAAHERSLQIHAWLNPYRISNSTANVNSLADSHPAKKWLNDGNTANDRYVLTYKNGLYFNPSEVEVQKLIIDGVREIVQNYDVDGIHFDDYFYPFVNTVDEDFDKAEHQKSGTNLSLEDWRRANVNALISGVYRAINEIDSSVQFGISPSYHISNDGSDQNYKVKFADIAKWMNTSGYTDYIAPQIYFGYNHPTAAYTKVLNQWLSIPRKNSVKLYIGVAAYKIGTVDAKTTEWQTDDDILARQALEAKQKGCDGVFIFSYSSITDQTSLAKTQFSKLKDALKQIAQE